MRTPADRIALLEVLYGIRVGLTLDGQHLDVTGPSNIVRAAFPMLGHYRPALIAYLHEIATMGSEDPMESLLLANETTTRSAR